MGPGQTLSSGCANTPSSESLTTRKDQLRKEGLVLCIRFRTKSYEPVPEPHILPVLDDEKGPTAEAGLVLHFLRAESHGFMHDPSWVPVSEQEAAPGDQRRGLHTLLVLRG